MTGILVADLICFFNNTIHFCFVWINRDQTRAMYGVGNHLLHHVIQQIANCPFFRKLFLHCHSRIDIQIRIGFIDNIIDPPCNMQAHSFQLH